MGDDPNRLIPLEEEDWFRENLEYYWNEGLSAKEIAKEMQFKRDENGDAPWSPLEIYHVYYFAKKYGLPKRNQKRKKREEKIKTEEKTTILDIEPWRRDIINNFNPI